MEGEAVEIFTPTFKYLKPKVARTAPKTNLHYKANRALALPPFKFRRANPTSDPSLNLFINCLCFSEIETGLEICRLRSAFISLSIGFQLANNSYNTHELS